MWQGCRPREVSHEVVVDDIEGMERQGCAEQRNCGESPKDERRSEYDADADDGGAERG
jgi:hypothetical protein